jgi:hypothetical protein
MEQIQHFLYTPFLSFRFYLLQYTQIEHNRMRSRCKQCSGSSICASTTQPRKKRVQAIRGAGLLRAQPQAHRVEQGHQFAGRASGRDREREHCLINVFFHSRVFKYKFLSPATYLPLSEQTISSPTCGLRHPKV